MQATRTTTVPWITWFCLGHSTFCSSAHDSWMKPRQRGRTGAAAAGARLDLAGAGALAAPRRHELRLARHG